MSNRIKGIHVITLPENEARWEKISNKLSETKSIPCYQHFGVNALSNIDKDYLNDVPIRSRNLFMTRHMYAKSKSHFNLWKNLLLDFKNQELDYLKKLEIDNHLDLVNKKKEKKLNKDKENQIKENQETEKSINEDSGVEIEEEENYDLMLENKLEQIKVNKVSDIKHTSSINNDWCLVLEDDAIIPNNFESYLTELSTYLDSV